MKNVIAIWNESSPHAFESNIPLLWSGKRNLKLGSKNHFEILLLDGAKNYPKQYLNLLSEIGYSIHDVSNIYNLFSRKYFQLNRFKEYEKKWFLRWLVIQDFYGNSPLIHFDGDIVFNTTPEFLTEKVGQYTFVLQGCPAFVSINDPLWLERYRQALDEFVKDIEGYSRKAWEQRKGWRKTFRENWAGSRFRRTISSDQDLISHLIHTEQIPQANPLTIKKAIGKELILFENPLFFFEHNLESRPFDYQRKNQVDYFNNRKVAFWHMQTNFVDYLKRVLIFRERLHLPLKIHNPLVRPRYLDQQLYRLLFASNVFQHITRSDIYHYFFQKKDFAGVFNNQVFWQNVFSQEAV